MVLSWLSKLVGRKHNGSAALRRLGGQRPWKRVRLCIEALEQRLAPATVSDGGTSTLSIVLGVNQTLGIISTGASYTFTCNANFNAANASNPANQGTAFSGFGTKTLILTSAGIAQYTTGINITDSGANVMVAFNDSGANVYANNLTVALSNAFAGGITFNGNSHFDAFTLQASTVKNIIFNSGASLSSNDGNLTLKANQQSTARSGDFAGITVNNAAIKSTGSGLITVQGQGGDTGTAEYGVFVENGGTITGGAATVSVNGTGGPTSSAATYGVYLLGTGSAIGSSGGNVQVTGQGPVSSSAGGSAGIAVSGGQVTAGGAGTVTLQGTGGMGSGSDPGVSLTSSATISSSGGNVQITGQGGSSSFPCDGIAETAGSIITAGGSGTVTVMGTAGGASGSGSCVGVFLDSATITSGGGNVQVTGVGGGGTFGAGPDNDGVYLVNSAQVSAGGTGSVTVMGTGGVSGIRDAGVDLYIAATITSGGGNVQVIGQGGASLFSSASSGQCFGVWITLSSQVTAQGTGSVTVQGTGGMAPGGRAAASNSH